jgi:hypothetical protein
MAPYGSWKSPITSDLIVAQSVTLSELCLDGAQVYWLEGRPQEQGRYVVVRADPDSQTTDITPSPYNARTRVHEYGGGSWTVHNGTVYFSNFADGRLYRKVLDGSEPRPFTPEPPGRARQWRYADGVIDQSRNRWIGVREDHTVDGEPVNAIVAVDLAGGSKAGLRAGTIFMARRGSRRMDGGSHGLLGIIPTCLGTARGSTSARSLKMADLAKPNQSPAERQNRSSNPNGPPMARTSFSCPIAPAGGTFIPWISRNASDTGAGANGSGVWIAAMAAWHVDLCFRRAGPDRLHLFARRTRLPRRAGRDE